MSDPQKDCLSFGDALFLHLERPGMPLHVAALCLLDGHIELEELIEHVQSRLWLLPRYQQKVTNPPYGVGIPLWQHDPEFNIRNHIHEVTLAKGTERELNGEVARRLSEVIDRQKPLWKITLIQGMKSGRTAMLARLHHCLADGISGIGILKVMLDPSPVVVKTQKPKTASAPSPPRDQGSLFLETVATTCFSTVERLLNAQSEMLKIAQHAFVVSTQAANGGAGHASKGNGNSNGNVLTELARALPEFASPTERLPFNIVCQGPQKYAYTSIPFQQIRAIKRKTETTVNDVVLTIVASAMRKYAQAHEISAAKRLVRIVVPVSVRSNGELGNQITFLPVTVPLGIKSPLQLLRAVHERMQLLKAAKIAELIAFAGTILGTIPNAVSALLGPIASQLPLSVCNLICTNVPGPKEPLYLLGRKMLTFYPYVPIGGEMGMNIAVLSYNGAMYVGFTGDAKAIPDIDLLPNLLVESFTELQKAAGVRPERPKTRPSAKKRVPRPKRAVVEKIPEPPKVMSATA